MPKQKRGPKGGLHCNRKYKWEKWFSGCTFRIKRGKDYEITQSAMAGQVRSYASKLGISISLVDEGDSIYVEKL